MLRKAVLFQVKPEYAAEYVRRHNPAPPEVLKIIKDHGVSNYSIYLHEPTGMLFGYFECEEEAELEKIGNYETSIQWWKSNAEILVCDPSDPNKGKEEELREVFHLD